MTTESVRTLRDGIPAEEFLSSLCDLLQAAFPDILSIYLLGSRAVGTAIPTSDVDLAVIFKGGEQAAQKPRVRRFLDAWRRLSPVMMDLAVLDEAEVRQGVKPHLKLGRLLVGPDVIKTSPLRPQAELLLLFAGAAFYFIPVVRNFPPKVRYPLAFPDPASPYRGYEAQGICTAPGRYRPGFSALVNLVVGIANFRLALLKGIFTPNKSLTVSAYREHLPNDRWLPLVAEIYETCRLRLQGELPETTEDRARLSHLCAQVLEFENDFLGTCILSLDLFLAVDHPDLQRQVAAFVRTIETDVPPQAGALAEVRRRLGAP